MAIYTQNWNEEIFTKYNNISSTDHTFYVLLDVFFLLLVLCWFLFSLFSVHIQCSCSFPFSFAAIQNEQVNERILNSLTIYFLRRLLLPFQDFHLLLLRKMSICMYLYIQCQISFAISAFMFQCWLVNYVYCTYHAMHIKSISLSKMYSLVHLPLFGMERKIIHTQNFFGLYL